jgi:hypothetical protein
MTVEKTQQLLEKHFVINGTYHILSNGHVNVDGTVRLRSDIRVKEIPVQFEEVTMFFLCDNNNLSTLVGSPKHVGQDFVCSSNPFLNSLDGAPLAAAEFVCGYKPKLPLLRLLQYENFRLLMAPPEVKQILNKYAGTGKKGSLAAAVELAQAGFKDNARW